MIRRSLAPLLLAGAALAQEAVPPNRFLPAGAQFTMRIKAPAVWHEQFAKTRLAKVFEGPTLAPMRKQAREKYPELLDSAAATGMPREVLQALVEDYRGELLVSVQFDVEASAATEGREPPAFAVMLALTPDGKFDLASLLAGFRKQDEKYDARLSPLQIGEHAFHVYDHAMPMTQAELIDGHLVMFLGTALEKLAPGMLARTNRSERLPADAPLAAHLDFAGFVDAIVVAANEQLKELEVPATGQQVLDAIGVTGLDAFDVSLGTAGERVTLETNLGTRGRTTGLFGAWFADAKQPALLRYVPPSVSSFSVSSLDFGAVVRAVTAIAELGEGKQALAEMEAAFREKTRIRLREDLLDLLGSEVMLLGDLRSFLAQALESARDGSRPDPNRVFADYCAGIALRDGKAFAASIDTLLRSTGLHAARKTEEYGGTRIHELRLGGAVTIEYAILDDVALVVLGTRGSGSDYLRAAIDNRTNTKATLPEAIAKRIDGVPDGWSGIGTMPIVDLVLGASELGRLKSRRNEPRIGEAFDFVRAVGKELKELGLGDATSVSYSGKRGLRTIYRW